MDKKDKNMKNIYTLEFIINGRVEKVSYAMRVDFDLYAAHCYEYELGAIGDTLEEAHKNVKEVLEYYLYERFPEIENFMNGYNEEWHERIRKVKEHIVHMGVTKKRLKKPYKYVIYELDARYYAWCLDVNIRREGRNLKEVEHFLREALKNLPEERN